MRKGRGWDSRDWWVMRSLKKCAESCSCEGCIYEAEGESGLNCIGKLQIEAAQIIKRYNNEKSKQSR